MLVQAQSISEPEVDAETAAPAYYPRVNTWSGGLNEMEEDWLLDFFHCDPALALGWSDELVNSWRLPGDTY